MAASYPAAVKSFSAIVTGTKLEAALLVDAALEIDAIEAELGILPHGTSGSLGDRLNMAISQAGNFRAIRVFEASNLQRRRMRAGVELINVDDLTIDTNSAQGAVSFSPATAQSVDVFLEIQTLESDLMLGKFD